MATTLTFLASVDTPLALGQTGRFVLQKLPRNTESVLGSLYAMKNARRLKPFPCAGRAGDQQIDGRAENG